MLGEFSSFLGLSQNIKILLMCSFVWKAEPVYSPTTHAVVQGRETEPRIPVASLSFTIDLNEHRAGAQSCNNSWCEKTNEYYSNLQKKA